MKKLLLLAAATLCATLLNAATIYLNTGGSTLWGKDNATFFVHAWETESHFIDVQMTHLKGDIYYAEIPTIYGKLLFVRMAEGSTAIAWEGETYYNQTIDLTIPDDKNMYSITGWKFDEGVWSLYDNGAGNINAKEYYLKGYCDGHNIEGIDANYRFTNGMLELSFAGDKSGMGYFFIFVYSPYLGRGREYLCTSFTSNVTHAQLLSIGTDKFGVPDGTVTFYLYDNGDETFELSTQVLPGKKLVDSDPDTPQDFTYKVRVPAGTEKCYIAGDWNKNGVWDWKEMTADGTNQFKYPVENQLKSFQYKYCSAPDWNYVELNADDSDMEIRTFGDSIDVVAKFKEPNVTWCIKLPVAQDIWVWSEMDKEPDGVWSIQATWLGGGANVNTSMVDDITSPDFKYITDNEMDFGENQVAPIEGTPCTFLWNPKTKQLYVQYTKPITFTLTTLSQSYAMGSVSGGGVYVQNSNISIAAAANPGYHFVQWQDGVTKTPRVILLTQDTTFTAEFAPDQYYISAITSDKEKGSATGSNTYQYGDVATLTAIPNEGFQFNGWSDGNTDNPRYVSVTNDATYTANFGIKMCTVTLHKNDILAGVVKGEGTFEYGNLIEVSVTPSSGYKFARWSDGATYNPYSFVIVDDVELTAIFVKSQADNVDNVENVTIAPADNSVTIEWPTATDALVYEIVIKKGDVVFCTLSFNAQGQLQGIQFVRGRNGAHHSTAAQQTATGWQFTITSLEAGTTYDYTVTAKKAGDAVVYTQSGVFTTTGTATGVDQIDSPSLQGGDRGRLILRDGQLYILRDGKMYGVQGQEVR